MSEMILPLAERSIADIYFSSLETSTFLIPIYQRNYAWEDDEIRALIKDVADSMLKDLNAVYYIGTLVTYNRGDNVYEVIDGQQRLTTIYIILKAMGIKTIKNKLTYGARRSSALTIQRLDSFPCLGDEVDEGIRNGYKYASKAIDEIVSDAEAFKKYFLNNVHIIHYSVPKDVDLNHYFEVMNSRGEQLEKHEIVKSMLSQYLDEGEMATFGRVWEACSEMNVYLQQSFPEARVFGTHLKSLVINDFRDIPPQDSACGKNSILDLMRQPVGMLGEDTAYEQSDKFMPIIDFPNFLLIVLKVTMMRYQGFEASNFVLDDKELLNEFGKALARVDDRGELARRFAFNLLKAKFLLDNCIVHHSFIDKEIPGDNPWKLQYYYRETASKQYPRNLSSDQDVQKELVQLLSMMEVTFTPKQRKNYLFYCMVYLFDNMECLLGDNEPSAVGYLHFLQILADKYYYAVYLNQRCLNERNLPLPNAFDSEVMQGGKLNLSVTREAGVNYKDRFKEIYQQGAMNVPLYVFNYTDYKLWKTYASQLRGNRTRKGSVERMHFFEALGCSDFELDTFNNFYFSRTRKSLEHFYPQAKAGDGKPLSTRSINCFGNFAMIGAQANSSGSNWDPKTKLDHYSDKKADQVSVASLKFKIMMQVCQDNYAAMLNGSLHRAPGMEWDATDMQAHQQKMLDILICHNAADGGR